MVGMQQVHGSKVVRVSQKDDGKIIANCDALISNDPEVTLYVRVADCLPISIIDQKSRSFGLIHAGWRGLSKGIIKNTIDMMHKELKIVTCNLKIVIGPHICRQHYEVKSDVSSKFSKYLRGLSSKGRRTFLDLGEIAREQLVSLGVKDKNIRIDKTCTFEDSTLPSFRRDKTTARLIVSLSLT